MAAAKALLAEFGTAARSDKGQALYVGAERSGRAWRGSPTGTATSDVPRAADA
ncbi:hypothetical protein SALBM217S_04766 [Streptomyces griseoloalbus]